MKFINAVFISAVFVPMLVVAGPLRFRSNTPAGAAYFITNEPTGNFIISSSIDSSGRLTLSNAINAGGRGSHGNDAPDPTGPDPLFSQGAVKASQPGKILATVNSGSNTLSVFSINESDPTDLKIIGLPVSSGGEFPVSLTISGDGNTVCALNSGQVNGVNCYKVDQQLGLVAIPNTLRSLGLNQTTPPTGPAGTASHIIFSEAGNQLIVSVKGTPPTPGFLAVWDVQSDGLSQNFKKVSPNAGGLLPFSMTIIPGGTSILATDAGVGFDIFDMSANAGQSNKSSVVPIKGQGATCWSSFSIKTGNFYLTDVKTSEVTEVNVDSNLKGAIVKQYPQAQNSSTIDNDVATINDKDFLYVMSPGTNSINVLSLNAPGQAQNIQTLVFNQVLQATGIITNPNNLQGMSTFVRQ